jgi:AraC family transcriptional regulator
MKECLVEPVLVERDQIILVGFSFFGDPFRLHSAWSEENEIGRLWSRFMAYMEQHAGDLAAVEPHTAYEVHLDSAERERTGEYEVFIGVAVATIATVPLVPLVKILPPTTYAVFTLVGDQIVGDWNKQIASWMEQAGYQYAYPYSFEYYDERFKGMDRIGESALDVYVPIRRRPL